MSAQLSVAVVLVFASQTINSQERVVNQSPDTPDAQNASASQPVTPPVQGPQQTPSASDTSGNKDGQSLQDAMAAATIAQAKYALVQTIVAGVGVLVAFALGFVALREWRLNQTAHRHTKAIERAYLNIGDWGFHEDKGRMQLAFSIVNSGHTPAYDVALALDARFGLKFPADAEYTRPPADAETFMLNGGATTRLARSILKVSIFDAPAIERGAGLVFYWGVLRYRDAFGEIHHQRFSIACEKYGEAWYATAGMKNDENG